VVSVSIKTVAKYLLMEVENCGNFEWLAFEMILINSFYRSLWRYRQGNPRWHWGQWTINQDFQGEGCISPQVGWRRQRVHCWLHWCLPHSGEGSTSHQEWCQESHYVCSSQGWHSHLRLRCEPLELQEGPDHHLQRFLHNQLSCSHRKDCQR